MTHVAGIDKGPILDWTNDNGLDECYRKWKKRVKVLFKGPLNTAGNAVKCNYIIYCSGDEGLDLVDKWETEGKLDAGNRDNPNRYFTLFEEHIAPKTNALIVVVELKEIVPRFHDIGRLPH